ncbi:MAG: hypothetical protein FJ027_10810 [Candidatus Rokubacteria bacterium]|nr:hypothetical protein [Candidatus Rokubacteria bacterium]
MRRLVVTVLLALAPWLHAAPLAAQPRPAAPPPAVAPGDEIKLDESSALRAVAIESRMVAIQANFQLLLRQVQDLQNEMNKAVDERKKLLEDAGRKAKAEVREHTEWRYDEAGQRYIRVRRNP